MDSHFLLSLQLVHQPSGAYRILNKSSTLPNFWSFTLPKLLRTLTKWLVVKEEELEVCWLEALASISPGRRQDRHPRLSSELNTLAPPDCLSDGYVHDGHLVMMDIHLCSGAAEL